jgi:eukaryotic-like serine/threonine-protein kinase
VPVADGVDYISQYAQSQFSASRNGILVYTSGAGVATEVQLTWVDRVGKALGTVGAPGMIDNGVSISPDGSKVAFPRTDSSSGLSDIWLNDLARGTESRFTFGPQNSVFPVWAPDGNKLAFYRVQNNTIENGVGKPWVKASSGVGNEELLDNEPRAHWVTDWSRDGRYLIENVTDPKTRGDIWVSPMFGDRIRFPYLATEATERNGKLSPDGRFLAYQSDESKNMEVYVQTFPEHGGKWQASTGGGSWPVWSRDGRELYFINPRDNKMMTVAVKGDGGKLDLGVPKPLFAVPRFEGWIMEYEVTKDGRFLIHVPQKQAAVSVPLTVVVNWQSALKK